MNMSGPCVLFETTMQDWMNKRKTGQDNEVKGTRALSDALKVNTTLTTLDLRGEQALEQW